MDDLAHEALPFHSLSRKRKADRDDHQTKLQDASSSSDPSAACEPMLVDSSATPRCPAKSADHPSASWLLVDTDQPMVQSWQTPSPPSSSAMALVSQAPAESPSRPKRPRIEIPQSPSSYSRRYRRAHGLYNHCLPSPQRYARRIHSGDTRDTGIVSATEPGPSRGSLLRTSSVPSTPRAVSSVPVSPVGHFSAHIPSHQPPINRETLKELDLEAILRNPQLRHDLLFDSGLQFRPTSSRRKRDLADNYWLAIVRELECGCTCFTMDLHGRPCERICVCRSLPLPVGRSVYAYTAENRITVRAPSRIRPLLQELLEVLISIIQPVVSKSTGVCVQPSSLQLQVQQNVAHVTMLRSVLDADLIQQEIDHRLFDPSGVFLTIGDVIRCHCAPMRDHAVDQMVALARSCAPGGTGTKVDAVRAIRLCFEIMELMKLDVANHQLQTLRPYLIQTSAQYELKTFQENRQGDQLSLDLTRQWLQSAYQEVARRAERTTLRAYQDFTKFPRRTQVQIAVTTAIVDLVFNAPPPSSAPSHSTLSPSTPRPASTSAHCARYPETLYLDHNRLTTFTNDAADYVALYMLLMLYRQLVFSGTCGPHGSAKGGVKLDELLKLKKEIWEIGPPHLGTCFQGARRASRESSQAKAEAEAAKWRQEMSNVVLQVTMRATNARRTPSTERHALTCAPDEHAVKLASSWVELNLRQDSPLSTLLRSRVRDQVLEAAMQLVVPSLKKSEPQLDEEPTTTTNGLEPLMPEINHLAERVAKLASIHLNVYGALYAQPIFVPDWCGNAPSPCD